MALGTKNRQMQVAADCKQHLREKYPDQLGLVEEYITEFEGTGKEHDLTRWTRFCDERRIKEETLERLETAFEKWLRGE